MVFNGRLWIIGGFPTIRTPVKGKSLPITYVSADGVIWKKVGSLPVALDSYATAVFDGKLWLTGLDINRQNGHLNTQATVLSSVDGSHWQKVTVLPLISRPALLVYKNKLWIIGTTKNGQRAIVMNSTDGRYWNEKKDACLSFPIYSLDKSTQLFNGRIWLLGNFPAGVIFYRGE